MCSRCVMLEIENARLQAEIARLMFKLLQISNYSQAVEREAGRVMSEHQPRGTWSFWRGCKDTAERVRYLTGR